MRPHMILLLVAFVLFLLDAFKVQSRFIGLTALGLACLALSMILS